MVLGFNGAVGGFMRPSLYWYPTRLWDEALCNLVEESVV